MKTSDLSEFINMGKKIIEISPGEYSFSKNPNEVLYTTGLVSCVGLALIEDINNERKRGLAHVYWGGNKEVNDPKQRLMLPKSEIERVDGFLKEFIGNFKGKNFEEIKEFGEFYSVMVFNRPLHGNTNYNENPLATYVMDWLLGHKANLKMSEGINIWEKQTIDSKGMALRHDKLAILYKNTLGKIINYGNTDTNLSDFPL